jgi:peptide-methionine (R)-S-oxide reductase
MSEPEKIVRTEAEWRAQLTPEQYRILREKDTERPFTGALTENHETGNYHCAGCGALLFLSGAKFDSGCGWPSFMLPAESKAIEEHEDRSLECGASRSPAPAAAATWATSFLTAPRPPACAIASTPPA